MGNKASGGKESEAADALRREESAAGEAQRETATRKEDAIFQKAITDGDVVRLTELTPATLRALRQKQEQRLKAKLPVIEGHLQEVLQKVESGAAGASAGSSAAACAKPVKASTAADATPADAAAAAAETHELLTKILEALRREVIEGGRYSDSSSAVDSDSDSPHMIIPSRAEDAQTLMCTTCHQERGKYFLWRSQQHLCYLCLLQRSFQLKGITFPTPCMGDHCDKNLGFASDLVPHLVRPYARRVVPVSDAGASGEEGVAVPAPLWRPLCHACARVHDLQKFTFPMLCKGDDCDANLGFNSGHVRPYVRDGDPLCHACANAHDLGGFTFPTQIGRAHV